VIRRHSTALRLAMMAADGLSGLALFIVVSFFRFGTDWMASWMAAGLEPWFGAFVYGATWMTTLWANDLYRLRARWTYRRELFDIVRSALLVAIGVFSALFIFHLGNVSRLFLLELFIAQIGVTVVSRIALRGAFGFARSRGYSARYIVIVGTGAAARSFARRIERRRDLGLRVTGYLSETPGPASVEGYPVLGSVDDIEATLHSHVVDEVAICLPAASIERVEPITRLCEEEGRIVRIPLEDVGGLALPGGRLEDFDGLPVMSLVYGTDRVVGLLVKRVLDVVGAAAAMIVLSPVFLAATLMVALGEGRPILFRQVRVGLHGRPFRMLKFRTMVRDAEEQQAEIAALNEIQGPAFKLTDDPRTSRVGRLLRRTSLDELPQLWNVLAGSMSLVGPRPPLPSEVEGYDIWHRRRLSMKPGMTGLWQVSARRDADFDRWVSLDLDYIDRWSLWLDLKIMLRTIPALLTGR
jgi:exopolysaccharide biosynthesis polyprenyl glycosylphosphotransferase